MAVRTLVFDFGNVLGFFDHRRAARNLAVHSGTSEEAIHRHLLDAAIEDAYESGQLTSAEFLLKLREACHSTAHDDHLSLAYADIFTPNDEVCDMVERLHGRYRLLLGSNTTDLHARRFREQFAEVLRHFDYLVLSYEAGARKPSAAFFDHCLKHAQARPEECVFIDDLESNVSGARACGWQGIVYRDPKQLRDDLVTLGIRVDGDPV